MDKKQDKEIYDFLAQKMLSEGREEQKNVLLFWADLITAEFESKIATAGLDSDDRAYIRDAVETWFYNTLIDLLYDIRESDMDTEESLTTIKRAVQTRVRNIAKDLLFERKAAQKKRTLRSKGKRNEKHKEPAGSARTFFARVCVRMSHLNPEVQDTVFMDPCSDAESQYLYQEMLRECEIDVRGQAVVSDKASGKQARLNIEDIGTFLAKQAHLETLRMKLAFSGPSEV